MLDPKKKGSWQGLELLTFQHPFHIPQADWEPGVVNPDQVQASFCESEHLLQAERIDLKCTA